MQETERRLKMGRKLLEERISILRKREKLMVEGGGWNEEGVGWRREMRRRLEVGSRLVKEEQTGRKREREVVGVE